MVPDLFFLHARGNGGKWCRIYFSYTRVEMVPDLLFLEMARGNGAG